MTQFIGTAQAIPALQLGPGSDGDWSYDVVTQTWVTTSSSFSLNAFANTDSDAANGDYAWDSAGSTDLYAYLVFAATPKMNVVDGFDVTFDSGNVTLFDSGYGTPPLEDSNSLAGHGIYDTYYEIYQFQFDSSTAGIFGNTQPGDPGSGEQYSETFDVTVNSLVLGALGIHFDLFTVAGNGLWTLGQPDNKNLVKAFAPFSHDAGYSVVPVPAAFWLFGTALIGFIGISRRTKV